MKIFQLAPTPSLFSVLFGPVYSFKFTPLMIPAAKLFLA